MIGRNYTLNKKNINRNIIFIILAIAILFNLIYYKFVYFTFTDLITQYAFNTFENTRTAIESNIDKIINEIGLIAKDNVLVSESSTIEQKQEFLTKYKEKENKLRLYIADLNGMAYSNFNEVAQFQEYKFFQNAIKGMSVISEPIYSYDEQKWVIAVAVPILNGQGTTKNILISYYNIDDFKDIIKSISIGDDTINLISTPRGSIITSNSDDIMRNINTMRMLNNRNNITKSLKNLFDELVKVDDDGIGRFSFDNEEYIAFYKHIKNDSWIIISAVKDSVLFKRVNQVSFAISSFTVFVAIIGIMIAIYSQKLNKNLIFEKQKIQSVLSSANLFIIKLAQDGSIIDVNSYFSKTIGYSKYELTRKNIFDIIPQNYINDFKAYIEKLNSNKVFSQVDIPIITKENGLIYVVWNFYVSEKNNPKNNLKNNQMFEKSLSEIGLIGTDISKIKEYEKKIQKLAYFDQLTGANNSTYAEEFINNKIALEGQNERFAFIFIDLDNFKYINDMFGHSIGDKFIIDICNRIFDLNAEKAKICRKSGDEFIIIYEKIKDNDEIYDYVEKVSRTIADDYYINSIKYNITASIGVSIYPENANSYDEIYKTADIAMNSAKEKGKGCIQYFNNEMKNSMYEMILIENDLKSAIDNNEFVLYYQPQYSMDTGKLYGYEALVRWISPTRGFVSPSKFIPQAEKNQDIIKIGDWVLETACDFINEVKSRGFDDICISVNVSVVQMFCDDYVEKTLGILKRKNIDSKNIKLEITESVLMESIDDMLIKIDQLNQNGIYFSLDDFGTGYSSLTYLNKIPLKVLKIDKSFVDMIIEKNGNKEIISSIIDLAHDIDLEVVAEGIEEDCQLQWLKERGCNIAQGFYMGKPMPKEKAIEELGKNMYNIY